MVSNNVGAKYNVAMQAGVPVQMQGIDAEKVKQSVDNSYLANRAKASGDTNPLAMVGVGTGVWYGLGQAMDKFNPACSGEYKDSILGKVGGWGDKVSTKTFLGRKFEGFTRWFDKFTDKLATKSKIVYSLKNHSTRPEWSWAKTPGAGLHGFLAMDTEQVFEEFLKPIAEHPPEEFMGIPLGKKYNSFQKLEQYGMKTEDIKKFADTLKGKDFGQKALALQKKELELLGVSKKMISQVEGKTGIEGLKKLARNFKVRMLGFNSMREYNSLKGNFLDNPDKVMKVLEKGIKNTKHLNNGKGLSVSIWRNGNKIKHNLFGRTVSLSEYLNKYKATLGKGNHTALGRFLPKAMGWFMEGCTNRFAGGKLAVAMQAGIFADMLIHTWRAPKGEKGKTFAERFVNDFTYFMAMTAGIMGMHKVGGFKYAGLGAKTCDEALKNFSLAMKNAGGFHYSGLNKSGVETYRNALEQFNMAVKNKAFANKTEYKAAKKALKELLGTKNIKNPITKLLQKIGSFINIGNERVLSYRSASPKNLNWLRRLANGNILGVPMRFLIPMLVVSPFLAKWATKTCHAIFGKPTTSVLDEDKEEEELSEQEKLQQEQLARLIEEAQKRAQQQNNQPFVSNNSPTNLLNPYRQTSQPAAPTQPQPFVSNNSPTNLLTMRKNGNPYQESVPHVEEHSVENVTTNTDNNNEPAPSAEKNTSVDDPNRTYIPSPDPVVITNETDLSPVDKALKRADAAEQLAVQTLSMRN